MDKAFERKIFSRAQLCAQYDNNFRNSLKGYVTHAERALLCESPKEGVQFENVVNIGDVTFTESYTCEIPKWGNCLESKLVSLAITMPCIGKKATGIGNCTVWSYDPGAERVTFFVERVSDWSVVIKTLSRPGSGLDVTVPGNKKTSYSSVAPSFFVHLKEVVKADKEAYVKSKLDEQKAFLQANPDYVNAKKEAEKIVRANKKLVGKARATVELGQALANAKDEIEHVMSLLINDNAEISIETFSRLYKQIEKLNMVQRTTKQHLINTKSTKGK